jgi:hypothetical protein
MVSSKIFMLLQTNYVKEEEVSFSECQFFPG